MSIKFSEDKASSIMHARGGSVSSIDTFYPRMMEPLAKPSELELSPREFFYWCDKGIINMPKAEKGQSPWSRLNLLDVFWIRIVKELRKFNLSFSAIVEIKKDLFHSQFDRVFGNGGNSNIITGVQGQNAGIPATLAQKAGGKRSKKGGYWGQIINQAVVPFGILGLQQTYRNKKHGGGKTRRHRRR